MNILRKLYGALRDIIKSAARAAAVTAAIIITASPYIKYVAGWYYYADANADAPASVWAEAEAWAEVDP